MENIREIWNIANSFNIYVIKAPGGVREWNIGNIEEITSMNFTNLTNNIHVYFQEA